MALQICTITAKLLCPAVIVNKVKLHFPMYYYKLSVGSAFILISTFSVSEVVYRIVSFLFRLIGFSALRIYNYYIVYRS